jgi:hypothetical protein
MLGIGIDMKCSWGIRGINRDFYVIDSCLIAFYLFWQLQLFGQQIAFYPRWQPGVIDLNAIA